VIFGERHTVVRIHIVFALELHLGRLRSIISTFTFVQHGRNYRCSTKIGFSCTRTSEGCSTSPSAGERSPRRWCRVARVADSSHDLSTWRKRDFPKIDSCRFRSASALFKLFDNESHSNWSVHAFKKTHRGAGSLRRVASASWLQRVLRVSSIRTVQMIWASSFTRCALKRIPSMPWHRLFLKVTSRKRYPRMRRTPVGRVTATLFQPFCRFDARVPVGMSCNQFSAHFVRRLRR